MRIHSLLLAVVAVTWLCSCGLDDMDDDELEVPTLDDKEAPCFGNDCEVPSPDNTEAASDATPGGVVPAYNGDDHEQSVIPGSSRASDQAEESETDEESTEVPVQGEEPSAEPSQEPDEGTEQEDVEEPENYDLSCAQDAAICRFCGPPIQVATDCPAGDTKFECQVFELVNEKRVAHGRAPLQYDATLAESAKIHAMDLSLCDFFAHDSLDGTTFFERCAANGYSGTCTGENIGGGQQTPQSVMDAWIDSPGHRHNMLYEHHTHVGISYYEGDGAYSRYWVKHFGRE